MKILIHPFFVVMAVFAVAAGLGWFAAASVIAAVVHEFGHAAAAAVFGIRAGRLTLLPFGAEINIECAYLPRKSQIIILLGGAIANAAAGVMAGSLLWLFPQLFSYLGIFIIANSFIAVLNLLPIYPLDGGKIIQSLGYKRITFLLKICSNIIFGVLFFMAAFVNFNWGVIVFSICMIFSVNLDMKQSTFTTNLQKFASPKHPIPVREIAVTSEATLFRLYKMTSYKHYTRFTVTDRGGKTFSEGDLERWLLIHPTHSKLGTVLST